AKALAKSVISSSLVKAMVYGHDANSGRILCALGYSGVSFDPENIRVFLEGEQGRVPIYQDGKVITDSEEEASALIAKPEVRVLVDMRMGEEMATAWGCDLTHEYVNINADYRS
ncbi:MAG: bifunctional ornithine acetyltransferase/N-acetylglutamate synthase, partial [Lachnospiraceae bacterium]|nr:bifunctional ornithine acetyltransferase/N-acetylglutamate synthase [Lachnospiraceae bacterium]